MSLNRVSFWNMWSPLDPTGTGWFLWFPPKDCDHYSHIVLFIYILFGTRTLNRHSLDLISYSQAFKVQLKEAARQNWYLLYCRRLIISISQYYFQMAMNQKDVYFSKFYNFRPNPAQRTIKVCRWVTKYSYPSGERDKNDVTIRAVIGDHLTRWTYQIYRGNHITPCTYIWQTLIHRLNLIPHSHSPSNSRTKLLNQLSRKRER